MTYVNAVEPEGLATRARAIDPSVERAKTPGAATQHHFNSAGAALQSQHTVNAVVDHLRLEQARGGYEAAALARPLADAAYTHAATLLHAQPAQIALFDSATTAMRQVLDALRLGENRHILVSRSTYVSQALQLMTMARERRVELVVIDNDDSGAMDVRALDAALSTRPNSVVCAAHVPTSSGLVEPAQAIGEAARAHSALFLLDATQSVGQIDLDVSALGCDVLVTTGRKFLRAPRGTAFAWVSEALTTDLVPWAPDVRASLWTAERSWSVTPAAQMLESWEHSVATRIGLATALAEAIERGMPATELYISALAENLRSRLRSIPGVTIADPPAATSGIVTFRVAHTTERAVCDELKNSDIFTIAVPASHAFWDLGARGIESVVRASVHVYTNEDDLDALAQAVSDIAARARRGVSAL